MATSTFNRFVRRRAAGHLAISRALVWHATPLNDAPIHRDQEVSAAVPRGTMKNSSSTQATEIQRRAGWIRSQLWSIRQSVG